MSTLPETRRQYHARIAIGDVSAIRDKPWARQYRTLCRQSGSFMRKSGLLAFLYFLMERKPERAELLQQLKNANLCAIHLLEQPEYTQRPSEAFFRSFRDIMVFIDWHKRMAEALIETPDPTDDILQNEVVDETQEAPNNTSSQSNQSDPSYIYRYPGEFEGQLEALTDSSTNFSLLIDKGRWRLMAKYGSRPEIIKKLATIPIAPAGSAYDLALPAYKRAVKDSTNCPETDLLTITTTTRLILGATKGPLDLGISLLFPYGVPVIAGSSLKGIAASFAEHSRLPEWKRNSETPGSMAVELFGGSLGKLTVSGLVDFCDAWWSPNGTLSPFELEIVNRHDGSYYEGKRTNGDVHPPDGIENPVPYTYLAVKAGTQFILLLRGGSSDDRKIATSILAEALASQGIGAKVRLGYGRAKVG